MEIKRIIAQNKNNKFLYYLKNYVSQLIPNQYFQQRLTHLLSSQDNYSLNEIYNRVNYYNKLELNVHLGPNPRQLKDLTLKDDGKTYYFDFYQHGRYFKNNLQFNTLFGDITEVPQYPAFTKSRPISTDNQNSVILKLNKIRHFNFIEDGKSFSQKLDNMVWRGKGGPLKELRNDFFKAHFDNDNLDIGFVNVQEQNPHWTRSRMTISEQLNYRYILALEGNDVASNLKWIMSSNSLAVMPKPRYETWFMEGKLIPEFHYVCINDDFSDLDEKMKYYSENPDKAESIIQNAHEFVMQFQNDALEELISLLVIQKYFDKTGQLT